MRTQCHDDCSNCIMRVFVLGTLIENIYVTKATTEVVCLSFQPFKNNMAKYWGILTVDNHF